MVIGNVSGAPLIEQRQNRCGTNRGANWSDSASHADGAGTVAATVVTALTDSSSSLTLHYAGGVHGHIRNRIHGATHHSHNGNGSNGNGIQADHSCDRLFDAPFDHVNKGLHEGLVCGWIRGIVGAFWRAVINIYMAAFKAPLIVVNEAAFRFEKFQQSKTVYCGR